MSAQESHWTLAYRAIPGPIGQGLDPQETALLPAPRNPGAGPAVTCQVSAPRPGALGGVWSLGDVLPAGSDPVLSPGSWDPHHCSSGDPHNHHQASVSGPHDGAAHGHSAALPWRAGRGGGTWHGVWGAPAPACRHLTSASASSASAGPGWCSPDHSAWDGDSCADRNPSASSARGRHLCSCHGKSPA